MASDRSQSSQPRPREHSSDFSGMEHDVNGDDKQVPGEASGLGLDEDIADGDEDGDLFGDDGDGEAYIKPYEMTVSLIEQSDDV